MSPPAGEVGGLHSRAVVGEVVRVHYSLSCPSGAVL